MARQQRKLSVQLQKVRDKIEPAKTKLTEDVATQALKYFLKNYEREGWETDAFKKWDRKKFPNGQKTLVESGELKRSIHIMKKTFKRIRIGTRVKYAKWHQTGTSKMVARPFLYDSKRLDRIVNTLIDKMMKKILR